MRRLDWLIVALALGAVVSVAAAFVIDIAWNRRAAYICMVEAPDRTVGYSIKWEWTEFAYVCGYRTQEPARKRVGFTDAFL